MVGVLSLDARELNQSKPSIINPPVGRRPQRSALSRPLKHVTAGPQGQEGCVVAPT